LSRTFAYCRVSTTEQATANQVQEIKAAGFAVEKQRVIEETVSGSVCASERKGFVKLLERMEPTDVLIVTKLDRLGRGAIDVTSTVNHLADRGIRVHCLQLGGMDLTSPAGAMTMGVLAHVAQFERDLIIERTKAGQARARASGVHMGRRSALSDTQKAAVLAKIADGETISKIAKGYRISRTTIQRIRDAAAQGDAQ